MRKQERKQESPPVVKFGELKFANQISDAEMFRRFPDWLKTSARKGARGAIPPDYERCTHIARDLSLKLERDRWYRCTKARIPTEAYCQVHYKSEAKRAVSSKGSERRVPISEVAGSSPARPTIQAVDHSTRRRKIREQRRILGIL
jgi:hypothetical protein